MQAKGNIYRVRFMLQTLQSMPIIHTTAPSEKPGFRSYFPIRAGALLWAMEVESLRIYPRFRGEMWGAFNR